MWPAAQYPNGFRADQVAERMIDHGLGLTPQEVELRSLFDVVGPRPLAVTTGHSVGHRLRFVTDNPVVVLGGSVLILRKRANPGGKHLPASYRIERRRVRDPGIRRERGEKEEG